MKPTKVLVIGTAPGVVVEGAMWAARTVLGAAEVVLLHPSDKPPVDGADIVIGYDPPLGPRLYRCLRWPLARHGPFDHAIVAWNLAHWIPIPIHVVLRPLAPRARLWLASHQSLLVPIQRFAPRRRAIRPIRSRPRVLLETPSSTDGAALALTLRRSAMFDWREKGEADAVFSIGRTSGTAPPRGTPFVLYVPEIETAAAADVGRADYIVAPSTEIHDFLVREHDIDPRRIRVGPPLGADAPDRWDRSASVILGALEAAITGLAPEPIPSLARRVFYAFRWRWAVRCQPALLAARPEIPPATFILMYHQIVPDGLDAGPDPFLLRVREATFRAQIEALGSLGEFVPLGRALEPPRDRPRFVLTFDDGTEDHILHVAPFLAARGIPATFFVVTGAAGRGTTFWWDRLAAACEAGPPSTLRTPRGPLPLPRDPRRALERAFRALQRLPAHHREEALAALPRPRRDLARAARWEAWKDLAGPFEVGGHTRTHPALAFLADAERAVEIAGAKRDAESILGRPVETFAYPFGGPIEVGEASVRAVEAAGYRLAVTTAEGPVRPGTHPLCLPRVAVRDEPTERLAQQLVSLIG